MRSERVTETIGIKRTVSFFIFRTKTTGRSSESADAPAIRPDLFEKRFENKMFNQSRLETSGIRISFAVGLVLNELRVKVIVIEIHEYNIVRVYTAFWPGVRF